MSDKTQRCSKRVRGLAASPAVVLLDRRRRTRKGDEGRQELEAEQRRKQSFSSEAEVTGSGAEAGRSTSQEETNPAGHGGRGRCRYAQGTKSKRGRYRCTESVGQGARQLLWGKNVPGRSFDKSSLAWDRSDLLRGPWENSLEERQDSLSSDVCLFSPERKERSGGVKRGRVSEDGDLFSPVRRRCGGFEIVRGVNEPGSDSNRKVASGATHEPELEEETQIESEASTGTIQQRAQLSVGQGGGTGPAGKQAIAQRVGGGFQPVPQNRAVGMAMIKFRAPPTFSGKQGEDSANWLELYESTAEYNRWGETEKRRNFGMHLVGPARKWFQCLNPPALWVDTAAVLGVGGARGAAAIKGLRRRVPQRRTR